MQNDYWFNHFRGIAPAHEHVSYVGALSQQNGGFDALPFSDFYLLMAYSVSAAVRRQLCTGPKLNHHVFARGFFQKGKPMKQKSEREYNHTLSRKVWKRNFGVACGQSTICKSRNDH